MLLISHFLKNPVIIMLFLQFKRACTSKRVGCPFLVVVSLGQVQPSGDEFCWRISRAEGLDHGPCPLLCGACHKLDPRIAVVVPQRALSPTIESTIGKYVSKGGLKLKQIMSLLASEFPDLITSERQVRNVMQKFQRKTNEFSCRSLLERLILEQRADPDLYLDYKINDDNELVGVIWITAEQRRAWLTHPDILIHDNTYDLDNLGFKLGNFNGIDELGRTIDLGTAFVLDETSATYEWQFTSWLEGMYNVPPTAIGSDADPAASLAIMGVFPTSLYFWCLWHIMQNLNKNLKVLLLLLLLMFLL